MERRIVEVSHRAPMTGPARFPFFVVLFLFFFFCSFLFLFYIFFLFFLFFNYSLWSKNLQKYSEFQFLFKYSNNGQNSKICFCIEKCLKLLKFPVSKFSQYSKNALLFKNYFVFSKNSSRFFYKNYILYNVPYFKQFFF